MQRRFANGSLDARFLAAALLLIFILSAGIAAARKDVRQGFDELAHVSYVAQLQSERDAPRLERLRMLDPATFRFTSEGNYLNHPSVYYQAMALAGPRLEGRPAAILWHRLINVAIVALGLGLLFSLSLAVARSPVEALVLIVPLFCIPVLAPLAGSVNNDNAGFLAGALTLFGSWRFLASRSKRDLAIALVGVGIAGAAKLTALMLCGGFLLLLFVIARARLGAAHLAMTAAACLVAAAPLLALWMDYGSPAPNTAAQHTLLVEGSRAAGWADQPRLTPTAYAAHFLSDFVAGWRPHLSDRTPVQRLMLLMPVLTLIGAAVGAALSAYDVARGRRANPVAQFVVAGWAAILATFIVHLVFSYARHVETGWLMDAYPRYYLPLILIVPLSTLVLVRRVASHRVRHALVGFLVAAPVAFGILG